MNMNMQTCGICRRDFVLVSCFGRELYYEKEESSILQESSHGQKEKARERERVRVQWTFEQRKCKLFVNATMKEREYCESEHTCRLTLSLPLSLFLRLLPYIRNIESSIHYKRLLYRSL